MAPPFQSVRAAPGLRSRSSTPPAARPAGVAARMALYAGRSLLPLVALALLLGTFLWGPWVTLGLTAAWWMAVTRWA